MINNIQISPDYNEQAILNRLDKVLDPELDESVLKLGFIQAIEAKNGHLTVRPIYPRSGALLTLLISWLRIFAGSC